jgi:phage-related protein
MSAEIVVRVPIRRIPIVIDTQDALAPEMALDDFRSLFGKDPDHARYRIVSIEVITSPDDQQPMLVSECGRYARFLRREADSVYFRRALEFAR